MSFWRHLFKTKADVERQVAKERALDVALEKNKAARDAVATEFEKVLRGLADELTHASARIGGDVERK